jgi:hypothetical protein
MVSGAVTSPKFFRLGLPISCVVTFFLAACGTTNEPSRPARVGDQTAPVVFDVRTLVIGNHAGSVFQVMNDLRDMGFALVERDRVAQILDDRDLGDTRSVDSDSQFLRRGFLAGAEMLVIVQIDGSRQIPAVSVKGLDVESGTILWLGGAISSQSIGESEYHHRLVEVAHRALVDGLTKQDGRTSAVFSHP